MHLPINITELLHDGVVESDRIEFKAGWNPEAVLRTMCAFANDFNNYGGGYIVIGVAEQNGKPVFPPEGIELAQADKIQKDLVKISALLKPAYTPLVSIEKYQDKYLLVIWAPGGQARPYAAPATLGKNIEYKYFLRKMSSTVVAKNEELKELLSLTPAVPFDDRVNHHATLEDIKLPLIQSFLKTIGSELLEDSRNLSIAAIGRKMAIIDGGNEYLKPRNVGLLFFNDEPEKFFPYIQIDVVHFPDGEGGDVIQEEIFKGPLDHQLRSALRHIKNFISERVLKIPGQAEAKRFFNYPFEAIEEGLVNAVYHRSYEIREPIEVRITPDCIRIISHPGPDPSISQEDVKSGRMLTRRYRNRRIGDFLKELEFTEGRGTGLPKMRRVLANNGSLGPLFFTDDGRLSFCTEIKIHPEFLQGEVIGVGGHDGGHDRGHDGGHDQGEAILAATKLKILNLLIAEPASRLEITNHLGYTARTRNVREALVSLLDEKLISYTVPNKPRSKQQRYQLTPKGKSILEKEG